MEGKFGPTEKLHVVLKLVRKVRNLSGFLSLDYICAIAVKN